MRRKEVLTTGEVAKICHVAPRTVSKWFDSGKLRGYRIPGSRDRRIPLSHLLQFMRTHGMPLRELEGHTLRILIVDPEESAGAVAEDLSGSDRYEVRTASNDFEAGMLAGEFEPHVMLVNAAAGEIDARKILDNLRANPNLAATKVVAMAGSLNAAQRQRVLEEGFDLLLCQPYELRDVVRIIEKATDLLA